MICLFRTFAVLFGLIPAAQADELRYFGYAGVVCDLDDPWDDTDKIDYSDEVAGFTNANQVCVTGDMKALEERLRNAARQFTPVFYLEPVFFAQQGDRLAPNPQARDWWQRVRRAIVASGVSPDDMVFYLVDEPEFRGLPLSDVSTAAGMVRESYPAARIMMIAAYRKGQVAIPPEVDLWGFDAYAVPDPAAEPLYMAHLEKAAAQLRHHQRLVLVLDANHTPYHRANGLAEKDMAAVARAYFALAQSRDDVEMLLGYTWAGGIDNDSEKGVRDLPPPVIDAHRKIGRAIVGDG